MKKIFFILVICLLISPASAYADTNPPTISNITPADGSTLTSGSYITLNFYDPDEIDKNSVTMKVNGQDVSASVNFKAIYDTSDTCVDPIFIGYDFTQGSISGPYYEKNGSYDIELTIGDKLGNITTYNWSFFIGIYPNIVSTYPENNERIRGLDHQVVVNLSQPGAMDSEDLNATINVDGVVYSSDIVRVDTENWQMTINLYDMINDKTVTVSGTVTNSFNLSTNYSFKFTPTITPPLVSPSPTDGTLFTEMPPDMRDNRVQARFNDIDEINDSSIQMSINGDPVPINTAFKEIWDTDTCSPSLIGYDYSELTALGPTYRSLKNGKYTVEVRGKDRLGNEVIKTWSFEIAVPPTIVPDNSWPKNSQSINSLQPNLNYRVDAEMNGGINEVLTTLQINGQEVDYDLTPNGISFFDITGISPKLSNEIKQIVSLFVYGNDGRTTNYNTSFWTNTYGEMPVGATGCGTCHDLRNDGTNRFYHGGVTSVWSYYRDDCDMCHGPTNTGCGYCHGGDRIGGHEGGSWIEPLPAAAKGADCMNCHTIGSEIHSSWSPGAYKAPVDLDYPHAPAPNSPYPFVHKIFPIHNTTFNSVYGGGEQCNDCHSQNLTRTHLRTGIDFRQFNRNCATCHNSTDPKVNTAVTANNTNCNACHVNVSSAIHTPAHIETEQRDACYGCHKQYIDNEHMKNTLDTVVSSAPSRITALQMPKCIDCHEYEGIKPVINAINNANSNCAACHDSYHTDQYERHAAPTEFIPSPIVTCTACHEDNLTSLHNSGSTNCESCHRTDLTNPTLEPEKIKQAIFDGTKECNMCHDEFGTGFHNNLDNRHTADVINDGRVECTACHSNVISDEHLNGNIPKTIKGLNYQCDSCHVPQSTVLNNVTVTEVIYAGYTTDRNDSDRNDCAKCHSIIHPNEDVRHDTNIDNRYIEGDKGCILCHSADLISEHDGRLLSPEFNGATMECNTCHTKEGKVKTVIDSAIADRSMVNVKANNDCTQCHDDGNDIHLDYPTAHKTLPSYIAGAEVTCSSCHGNDDLKVVHQSLVNLKLTNVDCLDCHNSGLVTPDGRNVKEFIVDNIRNSITNQQFSCNVCHAKANIHPELIPRHEADAYDTSIPVDCISCHDSNMKVEHIDKDKVLNCDRCHTDTATNVKNTIMTTVNDNTKANCIDCHTGDISYHTDLDTPHQSAFKADNIEVNCNKCHDTRLQVTHQNRGVTCNDCHTSTDVVVREAIKSGARDCTACHTDIHADREVKHQAPLKPEMACDACHYPNLMDEHLSCAKCHDTGIVATTGFTCNTCHNRGDEKTVNGTIVAFDVYTTIMTAVDTSHSDSSYENRNDCSKCHDIHTDLNDKHISTTDYNSAEVYCGSCHGNVLNIEHDSDLSLDCRTCHKSSDPVVADTIYNDDTNCKSCHGAFRLGAHSDVEVKHNSTFGNVLPVSCITCHNSRLTDGHVGLSKTGQLLNCNTCHRITDDNSIDIGINGTVAFNVYTTIKEALNLSISDARYVNRNDCANCHSPHEDIITPHDSSYITDQQVDCSKCHSDILQDEHGKITGFTCDRCHTSTDASVRFAIDTGTKSCNICHPVHSDIDADHQSNFLGNPGDSCTACHERSINVEHGGKFNSDQIRMNCNTCHESQVAKVLEAVTNGRKNCNDCHLSIHGDVTTIHESSFMDNRPFDCTSCHQASLIDVHEKLSCDTCHNSSKPEVLESITNNNTNCDSCHTIHKDVTLAHQSDFVVNPIVNCSNCHRENIADEHVLRSIDGVNMTCATCHDSERAAVKNAISNHDAKCDTCHGGIHKDAEEIHEGEFSDKPDIDCTICHGDNLILEHEEREFNCNTCHDSTDSSVKNAINEGNKNCSECHEIHLDVEGAHDSSYTGNLNVNCFNCHNSNVINEHEAKDYDCSTCHNSEKTIIRESIREENIQCNSCHERVHPDYIKKHESSFNVVNKFNCSGCHLNELSSEHERNEFNCNACHDSQKDNVNKTIDNHEVQCFNCHTLHENPEQAHQSMYLTEENLSRYLLDRYVDYPESKQQKMIEISTDVSCLRCHGIHNGK